MTKYIVVSGGVVSGIGKGVIGEFGFPGRGLSMGLLSLSRSVFHRPAPQNNRA